MIRGWTVGGKARTKIDHGAVKEVNDARFIEPDLVVAKGHCQGCCIQMRTSDADAGPIGESIEDLVRYLFISCNCDPFDVVAAHQARIQGKGPNGRLVMLVEVAL